MSIPKLLDRLADDPEHVDAFNRDPDAFMRGFGLKNKDRSEVLEYIERKRGQPDEFLERHAPQFKNRIANVIC